MTVIAFLPEQAVAVTDLLLSTDSPGGPPVLLPSVGSTHAIQEILPLSPTRLVRKIHRLSHGAAEVVMLVAGTVSHLEKLINTFEAIRRGTLSLTAELTGRLNLSDPLSILNTATEYVESLGIREFEFIAFHKQHFLDSRYDLNRQLRQTPYFGPTVLAGSGAPDLHRWLSERGGQYIDHRNIVGESDLEKHYRILNLIPSILLEEDTRETLTTLTGC